MRQFSDVEISRIKLLTENSVELAFIEPTQTGLEKSIMDATSTVRDYLKQKNVHDYDAQTQGPDHKIVVSACLLESNKILPSAASLYRPITKSGDPRIWFKGLGSYARPNDILGVLAFDGRLVIINITTLDISLLLRDSAKNPLSEIVEQICQTSNRNAEELLTMLRAIASKGPVPAQLNADTAIGRTLESLLGISINSSKKPDYKGIELKAFRTNRANRKTLFAQVPDWSLSHFKSSSELLHVFGYPRGNDIKLYCTLSTKSKNSQGLYLKMDNKLGQLIERSEKTGIVDCAIWRLKTLHSRLLEKHNETFWISAEPVRTDGKEHFVFKMVEHTRKPIVSQFDILLEQGMITLDHLIKKTPDGKVVEKGPLFKIRPTSLGLLFPPSLKYNLV